MADPLQRFWNVLKAKLGSTLDDLEDPEEQLALLVDELNTQIADLRKAVAIPLTQAKKLKLEIESRLAKSNEWYQRAVLALRQGEEDLARQALVKKEELEASALALQGDWETQQAEANRLRHDLEVARRRVDEAKASYSLLVARHKSAVAKKKIAEKTSSGTDDSAAQLMARLHEKILRIEAESEAQLELGDVDPGGGLEAKFAELERHERGEKALHELKAALGDGSDGSSSPSGALEPGTPSRVAELKAKLDRG